MMFRSRREMRQKSIYDRASAEKYVHFYRLLNSLSCLLIVLSKTLHKCANAQKQYNQQNISRM